MKPTAILLAWSSLDSYTTIMYTELHTNTHTHISSYTCSRFSIVCMVHSTVHGQQLQTMLRLLSSVDVHVIKMLIITHHSTK